MQIPMRRLLRHVGARELSGMALAVAAAALAGTARADTAAELEQMRQEMAAMRAELQSLRAAQGENWLNERRAEEVKALVREVLSDAELRKSLQGGGLTAGYDKGFFLASDDGTFRLNVWGQIQFRHITTFRDGSSDDMEAGFQARRTKVGFNGHVGDPRFTYDIILSADRGSGSIGLESFQAGVNVMEGVTVAFGKMKVPFNREWIMSDKVQLAVERSSVNAYFSPSYAEGVQVSWDAADFLKLTGMVHDGWGSDTSDFNADNTDLALTGRVDVKLAGDWKQAKEFAAWSGEPLAAFVGAAVHYEVAETGSTADNDKFLAWTVDGLVKWEGLNVFASFSGLHTDYEADPNVDDYGLVVQGGYMVIPDKLEPFVRYELLMLDDEPDVNILTVGANYYIRKHNAKLSVDVVWVMDPMDIGSNYRFSGQGNPNGSGLGLIGSTEEDMVAVRAQFQLLF